MKVIFTDIDGVYNYAQCNAKSPSGCLGIEDDNLELLKQIVDRTGAKIILTSTWKTEWEKTDYIEDLSKDGQYLVKKFRAHGLNILDKTTDPTWAQRGKGIIDFIYNFPAEIEAFVILDDESFDFSETGLLDKQVKTKFFDTGLTKEDVEKAVNILNDC